MSFKCGIVGLPNIGKSTLFNALTKSSLAESANYPFCTIDPNIGYIAVPDDRLFRLAEIANSKEIKYAHVEFVDIAGLVKGANKGEGLGNKFLANIREVDVIVQIVRCFINEDILHVTDSIDPLFDIEIIEMELILADLESVENRIAKAKRNEEMLDILKNVQSVLQKGQMANVLIDKVDNKKLKELQLLTTKKMFYVCNVDEDSMHSGNDLSARVVDKFGKDSVVIVSAAIESEIAILPEEERLEFMKELGMKNSGLDYIIARGYDLLNLHSFFTVGEKEARSWSVLKNSFVPQAAGVIHTDMQKGFIKADIISWKDYIEYKGEKNCKEAGKVRQEGRDYIVKDGDILNIKFNV